MAAGTQVPVVILATQPGALMHSALGIARSLGRLGVPCHLVHRRRRTAVSPSRFIAGTHVATYDEQRPLELVDRLVDIAARVGERPVLIPIDDPGALFLADHAPLLIEHFRFPTPNAQLSRSLADKLRLHDLAVSSGVPTPEVHLVTSAEDAREALNHLVLPVVVKVIDPLDLYARVASRAPSVVIAHTVEQLLAAVPVDGAAGARVLLQDYIPGGPDSVWMFNGYFDGDGRCRQSFTGQKVRQFRPETGSTSLGVCRRNDEVDGLARTFLEHLGYRGIVDLGFRYDARDGRYKLLDVNPRLGATFRLFVGDDGADVVQTMYRDLLGLPISTSRLREGRRWVVEPYDAYTAAMECRQKRLSLWSWAQSYRGVEEAAWFDRRDPLPFLAMLTQTARMAAVGLRTHRQPPEKPSPPDTDVVTEFFDEHHAYWDRLYDADDVAAHVYQARQQKALELVDRLGLPPGSRVLDVGAGSGALSCALAERGYDVTAADLAPGMLESIRRRADAAGVTAKIRISRADVRRLPFRPETFDLVVALGVLPWLRRDHEALREMRRVLRPGAHVLLTADNRKRLNWRIDPRLAPGLRPVRRALRRALVAIGAMAAPRSAADARQHTLRQLTAVVDAEGFDTVTSLTVGFGPFTMMGRPALPPAASLRLDDRLQHLADAGTPGVRSWGGHHVLVCRRAS